VYLVDQAAQGGQRRQRSGDPVTAQDEAGGESRQHGESGGERREGAPARFLFQRDVLTPRDAQTPLDPRRRLALTLRTRSPVEWCKALNDLTQSFG
jgi:hypothetical protein